MPRGQNLLFFAKIEKKKPYILTQKLVYLWHCKIYMTVAFHMSKSLKTMALIKEKHVFTKIETVENTPQKMLNMKF